MGKPYRDLEQRAIAILANGGNPATSQDQAVARYWQWKINPSSNAHKLPATSVRTANRKKDPVYLLPFAVNLNTSIYAKAQITKRTNTALPAGVKSVCGYKTLSTGDQGLRLNSYKPAYVYWRTGEAATSSPRTSRITNRTYKSYYAGGDEGYLAPFGRQNTADTEGDRQKVIKAAFGTGINLITFTPEMYRG
jgi:hypothetical protein